MASDATSDGTPNAKQLVFLFMAATVVAVVVFLCGVLVGRGVPLRSAGDPTAPGFGTDAYLGDALTAVGATGTEPPSSVGDDLTYSNRLESGVPVAEVLRSLPETGRDGEDPPAPLPTTEDPGLGPDGAARPVSGSTEPSVGAESRDTPQPVSEPVPGVAAAGSGSEPPTPVSPAAGAPEQMSGRFAVQVAAYREQATARDLADRLIAKGFPTYVVGPGPDAPVAVYRVRVGPYLDRQEAERIRLRLELEERFKPWVTR